MRIKHRYSIESKKVIAFLDLHQIKYEISEVPGNRICHFDLYEDQDVYELFKKKFPIISKTSSWKYLEYSKEEITSAKWLVLKSSGSKVQYEYTNDAFAPSCQYKRMFTKEPYFRHYEQIGSLSSHRIVRWGARQFFTGPNSGDDMIFCSEKAKELLNGKYQGLEFWPVKKYNKGTCIEDLHQLIFTQNLPLEAISGGKSIRCKGCGKTLLLFKDYRLQFKIKTDYLTDTNCVYTTGEILTEDVRNHETFSLHIVSNAFYQYCEENNMNKGLSYEPIELI